MTSLPAPPTIKSGPARPRILSSPSKPFSLSGLSVPESRPPLSLGQPGRSFVVKTTLCFVGPASGHSWIVVILMVRVRSHRASSSEAVVLGELPCSFLEVSERGPEQPTTRRRKAHPIREALTTDLRCPLLLDLAGAYKPHHHQEGRHHR